METVYVHADKWREPYTPDENMIVCHATRPLFGEHVWESPDSPLVGWFFAAVPVGHEYADSWMERNEAMDARMVRVVNNAEILAIAAEKADEGCGLAAYVDALGADGPREFARANRLPWSDTDTSGDAAIAVLS